MGIGTSFPGGFQEFMQEIESGGVGAMEMVSRDMKALGMYLSGSISFGVCPQSGKAVEYRERIHRLTPKQREMYNRAAVAWQAVLRNIDEALLITNGGRHARATALNRFWGDHQRFFRQVICAFKVPAVIAETEAALSESKSVVISLVGTGEARTREQVAKAAANKTTLEELDFSPREVIAAMVDRGFPTTLYQDVTDPATGKTIQVPVRDGEGNLVQSRVALQMKQALIDGLSALELPENPLDQLVNHFGEKNVAELTGRTRRLIRDLRTGHIQYKKRAPEGIAMDRTNVYEMEQFQSGQKRVAIISYAASTGISLHASNRAKNQQRRVHITLEKLCKSGLPEWSRMLVLSQLTSLPVAGWLKTKTKRRPVMKILALDLGKYKSVACVYETAALTHRFATIVTTPQALHDLLVAEEPERVVIEICPLAGWVSDLVGTLGIELEVASTTHDAWRWKNVKRKNDRQDGLKLAQLSALGQLTLVHMPAPKVRQWRALINYRQRLVSRRTRIRNHIRALLLRQAVELGRGSGAWTRAGLAQLEALARPLAEVSQQELWRGALELELAALKALAEPLRQVEQKLDQLGEADKRVQLLRTIPGVGPRGGEALVAVIDEAQRFKRGKEVGAYLGLVPKQMQSGESNRLGRITHQGNSMLRSLLVEISWSGLRYNSWMRAVYERVRRGSKARKKIAIVAVARRLLIRCWAMLRDGTTWRPATSNT